MFVAAVAASAAGLSVSACSWILFDGGYSGGADSSESGTGNTTDGGVRDDSSDLGNDAKAAFDGADGSGSSNAISDAYRAAVLADAPLAYWRFEETSGATVARDEMGKANGEYRGAVELGTPGVATSRGVIFPQGSKSHMRVNQGGGVGGPLAFAGQQAFTIEAWVRPTLFKNYEFIVSTESASRPRRGWSILAFGDGTFGYEGYAPNDGGDVVRGIVAANPAMELDRFYHFVTTYDGSTATVYLDGTKRESYTTPAATSAGDGPLLVGCSLLPNDVVGCVEGWTVDEVALYDHVLPPANVATHYAAGIRK